MVQPEGKHGGKTREGDSVRALPLCHSGDLIVKKHVYGVGREQSEGSGDVLMDPWRNRRARKAEGTQEEGRRVSVSSSWSLEGKKKSLGLTETEERSKELPLILLLWFRSVQRDGEVSLREIKPDAVKRETDEPSRRTWRGRRVPRRFPLLPG